MFTVLFLILILVIVNVTIATNEKFLEYQFKEFMTSYNKKYTTIDEERQRFHIFIDNLKLIESRNMLERSVNGTAIHGINKFSDLTVAEFKQRFLGVDTSKPMKNENAIRVQLNKKVKSNAGLVDWTGIYTTPVKDQGYCGSCWAFSATEQIESDNMRVYGTDYILAPQQITSCDPQSYGCSGGWPYCK